MSSNIRDTDVRSGPDRYVSGIGVARDIGGYLDDYRQPVLITGERSWEAFSGYADAVPDLPVLRYDGSATVRNASELADRARALHADAVIAVGAGKLSDTAKNVAEFTGAELIMVPTLAATCAAYSALSVNYDEKHRYANAPLHPRNSNLVLVDAALIARGPREYLVGGIGDTLAKWYESRPVFARAASLSAFDRLSQQAAAELRSILLEVSEAALRAHDRGVVDEHLLRVIDTNLGLAGTVGGFGGTRARASGAHSMHDALTQIPGTSSTVHGAKVAYGIIVQLLAEGDADEARSLVPFYDSVGLPHSLRQMGLDIDDADAVRVIAEFAAGDKAAFAQAVPGITADDVVHAMRLAESLA